MERNRSFRPRAGWVRSSICACALALSLPAIAEVRIGFLATLSGPAGALGQDQYDAFMLAIDQLGGKLGGQPVRVIKEDDALKPDLALQLAQKLIEREKVQIVTGLTFSNVMMAVAKRITGAGVFVIGSNAGPSPLAGAQCDPNLFMTSWQNDQQHEVLGKYAAEQGYRKLYLMAPNYQAGKDSIAGFKRQYKGAVLDEVYTPLNQPDYSAEIAQLAAAKPDAVFMFYPGAMGVNFVKQFSQAGLLGKVPLLSVTIDGTILPVLKDSALGSIVGQDWGPLMDNAANKRFVTEFEKRYNRIPSLYAAHSYDAALLLDAVIRKTNGDVANKDALRAALKTASFDSVRGSFRFNSNNFPIADFWVFEVGKDPAGRVNLLNKTKVLPAHKDAYYTECKM